jgi:integrase
VAGSGSIVVVVQVIVRRRAAWNGPARPERIHQNQPRSGVDGTRKLNRARLPPTDQFSAAVDNIHFILSGAYKKAVRWRWVAVSPIIQAEPPAAPKENPDPPTPDEAARILTEAWADPDWGTQLWVAMTTGARRGEICAIRWRSTWTRAGSRSGCVTRSGRAEADAGRRPS